QAIASEILAAGRYAADPCGYHLWVPLPAGSDPRALADALRAAGMTAIPGDRFAVATASTPALRVSLGGAIDRAALRNGLATLAGLMT
ncbi:MAG: PLP-dependent aminotransferase family protein, partial [Sphingomonadales bacterium]|nr:PLP-dependent aminotransferase family protein [Sphingomonadales bacterium]